MNYNGDGFNERSNYIHNCNDINKLKKNEFNNFDNSFAKMKSEEHKYDVKTVNNDKVFVKQEAKGNIENFVLRNTNMRNVNVVQPSNNPVANALNKNMFKK